MKNKITENKIIMLLLVGICFVYYIYKSTLCNPDNDMWWMMSTGRYILEHKEIPTINPFVIHDGFEMIVQQWLLAIVNYLTYSSFGKIGLIVLTMLIFLLNQYLIMKWIKNDYYGFCTKCIVLLIGMFSCGAYMNTRPTQFTIAILLVEQLSIARYKKSSQSKYLWSLPVLSILAINIQSALWLYLFIMLLPHITPCIWQGKEVLVKQLNGIKDYLLPTILSVMAGIINPNGLNGMLYLFKSHGSAKIFDEIQEMQSPDIFSFYGLYIVLAVVCLTVYLMYKGKEADRAKVYMMIGVIILSMVYVRNIWSLLFGFIPIVGELISLAKQKSSRQFSKRVKQIVIVFLGCVLMTEVIVFFQTDDEEKEMLSFAADYLDATHAEDVILFTTFDAGGYMEWRGYAVYIDARPELFQKKINGKKDVADEYFDVCAGDADYEQFVKEYQFTHMLVDKKSFIAEFLKWNTLYEKVSEEDRYALYERKYKEE